MGDFGFSEMIVIAIIAIIIYGKNLPQAARKVAQLYGKVNRQVRDLRDEIQRQMPPDTDAEPPALPPRLPSPPHPEISPPTHPDDKIPGAK